MAHRINPRRPAHRANLALVIACLALVAAVGTGAYAAITLPKNSVKSRQIKNGQVKSVDIGARQVKPADLAAGIAREIEYVEEFEPATDDFAVASVECPAGKVPIGGGASYFGSANNVMLRSSLPLRKANGDSINGWNAQAEEVDEGTPQPWDLRVVVACARL